MSEVGDLMTAICRSHFDCQTIAGVPETRSWPWRGGRMFIGLSNRTPWQLEVVMLALCNETLDSWSGPRAYDEDARRRQPPCSLIAERFIAGRLGAREDQVRIRPLGDGDRHPLVLTIRGASS